MYTLKCSIHLNIENKIKTVKTAGSFFKFVCFLNTKENCCFFAIDFILLNRKYVSYCIAFEKMSNPFVLN